MKIDVPLNNTVRFTGGASMRPFISLTKEIEK